MKEYRTEYKIANGLRKQHKSIRDSQTLAYADGIFPEDGILKTHEEVVEFVHGLNCTFPYPQIFTLRKLTIICTEDTIYEYASGNLTQKITGLTGGAGWSVADFYDYLYFTNGEQVVIRDSASLAYAIDTTKLTGHCCTNLNGQLLVGGIKRIL